MFYLNFVWFDFCCHSVAITRWLSHLLLYILDSFTYDLVTVHKKYKLTTCVTVYINWMNEWMNEKRRIAYRQLLVAKLVNIAMLKEKLFIAIELKLCKRKFALHAFYIINTDTQCHVTRTANNTQFYYVSLFYTIEPIRSFATFDSKHAHFSSGWRWAK